MPEAKWMAEEAKRMGEEAQEQALRLGHEYQKAAEGSFEAASRSFGEVNRGWQAIAAEVTEFLEKTLRGDFAGLGATSPRVKFRRSGRRPDAVRTKGV